MFGKSNKPKLTKITIRLDENSTKSLLRMKGLYTYRNGIEISDSDAITRMLMTAEEYDAYSKLREKKARGSFNMIIGLPYSGKTTYAHELAADNPNVLIISAEEVAKELHSMEDSEAVMAVMVERAIEGVHHCNTVVVDCEGLSSSFRRQFLSLLSDIDTEKTCIVMNTAAAICENRAVDKKNLSYLKDAEGKRHYYPSYSEGWHMVRVITDGVGMISPREEILPGNNDIKWDLTGDREAPIPVHGDYPTQEMKAMKKNVEIPAKPRPKVEVKQVSPKAEVPKAEKVSLDDSFLDDDIPSFFAKK